MLTDRRLRLQITVPLWIVAFGVILSGCAGPRAIAHRTSYPSPESALRALAASAAADRTLTATARIEISHQGTRYPLKIAVMMKRPGSLRVESIPLLGPPDFFLSIAEGELRVYLPKENVFYIGRAVPGNISKFFPLSLPIEETLSLMMGIAPENRQEPYVLHGEEEGRYYRVDGYRSDRKTRSWWIDPSGDRLVRIRTFAEPETVVYEATFGEHVPVGDGFMPERLSITGDNMVSLSLRYTGIREIAADPDSLPLPLPEGVVPTLLDP